MCKAYIEGNLKIEYLDEVIDQIEKLSGRRIKGFEIIRRFINEEKNTRFYVDKRLHSQTSMNPDCTYLWLDTGYTDAGGKPIMISLLKENDNFRGHYVGTPNNLMQSAGSYFHSKKNDIRKASGEFNGKYQSKISARTNKHINDEEEFLITSYNRESGGSEIGRKLTLLNLQFDEEIPVSMEGLVIPEILPEVNKEEEQITISLLLDKLEEIQDYVTGLESIVEKCQTEKEMEVNMLQQKNTEYRKALMEIRTFMDNEVSQRRCIDHISEDPIDAHSLLKRNKKILVLGDLAIDSKILLSIAKNDYGFLKGDLEFVTDYRKVVHTSGRIIQCDRYQAVIFGCVPHKVARVDDWSSIIEKFKQSRESVITVDSRTAAGGLKVTKSSFREALNKICFQLRKENDTEIIFCA